MPPEIKIPNSSEIDQALKEFEMGSSTMPHAANEQVPIGSGDIPKIVQLVMNYSGGVIKEQRQAEYVLLTFVIVAIGVSLFLFISTVRFSSPPSSDKIIKVAGPQNGN